ncbi:hypothetical protein COU78_00445 [Candidatus Peregrinibacteria bacterium CG10_big_fil_rev_8_21_14_0_10_49_24]|nr:MAG: hypothetical protein COV83_06490 [Candidatus Peregrinibacteria bacterium CG11_big_fil_rev_8_21_14_0_20_49_14]PIR51656.1 MAG: hypothetical protein COU78_00445 [Candidatus Peregrinibacteria bacterium CG10_big_fil_rev_8_21_14_0_10_49_24]PJA67984.1 MAG: hypothetical protein CO157_01515 [Candidatus Peregrinibacteria bacterium CG_4_9_14_3_um_filter_49_12]
MIRKIFSLLLGATVLVPSFAFAASDSMMMENDSMMSGEHMGMMMTHGLDASCGSLRKLSTDEKAQMLTDIGHNMDAGALRQVYRCLFTGAAKKRIARITDNALKLDPKKPEMVYYIPSTQQFFVTCTGMKTVAYVVQGKDVTNPKQYFEKHHSEFAESATMARMMFEDMMKTQMMK